MTVRAIWAQARDSEGRPVIGRDGTMPWHLPEDLAHFSALTGEDVVIMGRLTWESLPPKYRPLPRRTNIVVSRTEDSFPGAASASSLEAALEMAEELDEGSLCWVIGGAGLFEEAMQTADWIEVTEIDAEIEGDTFAPEIPADAWEAETGAWLTSEGGLRYRFVTYRRA